MKLCQRCTDAILNDVFGMNKQMRIDSPPCATLEVEDPYVGIKQKRPADPESECEFWAHELLNDCNKALLVLTQQNLQLMNRLDKAIEAPDPETMPR